MRETTVNATATSAAARLVVAAPGPSEASWRERLASLPPWPLPRGAHVVVVGAHPDDETLGIGGTLQLLVGQGARIDLVAITDGEASHPDVPALAARRRRELRQALARLGILRVTRVHRLGVPDGAVADHEDDVTEAVARLVTIDSVVLGPSAVDGHTDHDAAGRASAAAGVAAGVGVLAYPVWAWQWHDPAMTSLLDGAWRVPLTPSILARKRHATAAFTSQVTDELGPPVVPPHVLARLLRPDEVLVPSCA